MNIERMLSGDSKEEYYHLVMDQEDYKDINPTYSTDSYPDTHALD